MSKGPGKWQRIILDELAKSEWFFVADLLPKEHTPSDYNALMRAINVLARKGRLSVGTKYRGNRRRMRPYKVASRLGVNVNKIDAETLQELDEFIKELWGPLKLEAEKLLGNLNVE